MLHFDEKWIFTDYIKSYKNIEPKINEFRKFVLNIVNVSKKNLIITNGLSSNNITNSFRNELTKINANCYHKEVEDRFIIYFDKTNFFDIEYLINKSELLISCHGAPTHIAAALNKKIFDILDDSEELLFKKFSHHFRNYNSFFRKDFANLSKEIVSRLG